jgi:hypothetical protein
MVSLRALFEEHGGRVLENSLRTVRAVLEHGIGIESQASRVVIGPRTLRVQFLGMELAGEDRHTSGWWAWGWAFPEASSGFGPPGSALWVCVEAGELPPVPPDALRMSDTMLNVVGLLSGHSAFNRRVARAPFAFDPITTFGHYARAMGLRTRRVEGGLEAEVSPTSTVGALRESPPPDILRTMGPDAVGYSFPVSLDASGGPGGGHRSVH